MQEYNRYMHLRFVFFFFITTIVKMSAYNVVLVDVFRLCYVLPCSFEIRIQRMSSLLPFLTNLLR